MTSAALDEDGYPHDSTLARLREWDAMDFQGLAKYLTKAWHYKHYVTLSDGQNLAGDEVRDGVMEISTGGWSGNEEMIDALQRNWMWWQMHWVQSRRGGHFIFAHRSVQDV